LSKKNKLIEEIRPGGTSNKQGKMGNKRGSGKWVYPRLAHGGSGGGQSVSLGWWCGKPHGKLSGAKGGPNKKRREEAGKGGITPLGTATAFSGLIKREGSGPKAGKGGRDAGGIFIEDYK